MKNLKIGVIACGGRGENAWKAHQPENGTVIVAGVDVNPDARAKFRQTFPQSQVYADYRELLNREKLDAVFISSPLEFHEEMALAAMDKGCSVFLEKPMAPTVESCGRLLKAAAKGKVKFFVAHNLRNYSFLASLKDVVDSGEIGEVKTIWCRHYIGYSRHSDDFFHRYTQPFFKYGMLLHKGCHDIDAIHWLGGASSRLVTGMGTSSCPDGLPREDNNLLMLELENGVRASYLGCGYTPGCSRNYTVIGTLGSVENINNTIQILSNRHGKTQHSSFQVSPPAVDENYDADQRCVQNFLDALRFDTDVPVPPEMARDAVAAAVAGQYSIQHNSQPQEIHL